MRHYTSSDFWTLYWALPSEIRKLADKNYGIGHRLGHRLKPVPDMPNPLKRVERASSALQRTLAIRRRFESAVWPKR